MPSYANRDDFSAKTKRILAERVAYLCSNPDCMNTTIGPHSDPEQSLKTGRACHICAAAPGGPRYDDRQTVEERSGIGNGIWMCGNCSDRIDKDFATYPKEKLHEWRSHVEAFVSGDGAKPILPEILITTLNGIRTGFQGATRVTGDEQRPIRDHTLIVTNRHTGVMLQFQARLQFPEGIVASEYAEVPAGVDIDFRPERAQFEAHISGGGSIEQIGGPGPAPNALLGISNLLPGNTIEIHFRSVVLEGLSDFDSMFEAAGLDMPASFYLEGAYQSQWKNRFLRCEFYMPLDLDKVTRKAISRPVETLLDQRRMFSQGFF